MKPVSRLILFASFLFIGIYVLVVSAYTPHLNWDMIMYIAVAKSYEESDIKSLHTFTYSALQHSVSEQKYASMVRGEYRHVVHTDISAFEEQLPFYKIRPLYTGTIYLLHKAGLDIGFATHIASGIAVATALLLLYLLSSSVLGHPFSYAVPFLALAYGVDDLARYSTPDGMAFLAIILSAYLYFKDKIVSLLIFLPVALCIRTDLVLYTVPLLLVVFASKRDFRARVIVSLFLSFLLYFTIAALANNPGWSTIFYFTLLQHSTHPLSSPPALTVVDYLRALCRGLKSVPANNILVLHMIASAYCLGVIATRCSNVTSLLCVLRTPAASLSVICAIFLFSHFVLFPVAWNRFFVGPYLVTAFSLLIMMSEYWKMENAAQEGATPGGNSA